MTDSSVSKLLLASIEDAKPLGAGNHNAVFEIKDAPGDLPKFLFRIPLPLLVRGDDGCLRPSSALLAKLNSNSALTPPSSLYTPHNIAQPLLSAKGAIFQNPFIQIIERQEGVLLRDLAVSYNRTGQRPDEDAYGFQKVMNKLMTDKPELLKELFLDYYHLVANNLRPSSNDRNVMYQEGKACRPIDTFDRADLFPGTPQAPIHLLGKRYLTHRLERHSERFLRRFEEPLRDGSGDEDYVRTYSQFKEFVTQARKQAIKEAEKSGPVFHRVTDTKAVALTSPVGHLAEQLGTLQSSRGR